MPSTLWGGSEAPQELQARELRTYESLEFVLRILSTPGGAYGDTAHFQLEFDSTNHFIISQLEKAGICSPSVAVVFGKSYFTTKNHEELRAVYRMLLQLCNINDPDRTIEKIAWYGTASFPELNHASGNWDNFNSEGIKELHFTCPCLEFSVYGDPEGQIKFRLSCTLTSEWDLLQNRLRENGVGPEDDSKIPEIFCAITISGQSFLQGTYQVLSDYYPLQQYSELVERLAAFGNWKEEELDRQKYPLQQCSELVERLAEFDDWKEEELDRQKSLLVLGRWV